MPCWPGGAGTVMSSEPGRRARSALLRWSSNSNCDSFRQRKGRSRSHLPLVPIRRCEARRKGQAVSGPCASAVLRHLGRPPFFWNARAHACMHVAVRPTFRLSAISLCAFMAAVRCPCHLLPLAASPAAVGGTNIPMVMLLECLLSLITVWTWRSSNLRPPSVFCRRGRHDPGAGVASFRRPWSVSSSTGPRMTALMTCRRKLLPPAARATPARFPPPRHRRRGPPARPAPREQLPDVRT